MNSLSRSNLRLENREAMADRILVRVSGLAFHSDSISLFFF